jgi:PhzF family phenazine biosynthesis protein
MLHTLYEVHAFTANGEGGNPAGVLLNADDLNEAQMQAIAANVGFSETAFVKTVAESEDVDQKADYELRFFTPGKEVNLCGHATIATWSLMREKGRIVAGDYTQKTRAGLLGVAVMDSGLVFMEQNEAELFEEIPTSVVAPLLGLEEDEFHATLRPRIVSTGMRDLIVPLRDKRSLLRAQPDRDAIITFSDQHTISGLHVFSLCPDGGSVADARNFAPADDIDEESATGTSNGALLCYLRQNGQLPRREIYRINQGENMGLSFVFGKFVDNVVWIGGEAKVIAESEREV